MSSVMLIILAVWFVAIFFGPPLWLAMSLAGWAFLVIAGIVGFYWFADWAAGLRALLPLAGLIAGGAVFASTPKGRATIEYLAEARFELRKVIWPTRQETTRMAWVVIIVVIIVSLMLAGFDFVVQKAIQWFLGR